MQEYGSVAIGVWMTLFVTVLGSSYAAITFGADLTQVPGLGAVGVGGTFAMAYGATMLTKPVRILVTLAVTPFVASVLRRGPDPARTLPQR